ncbi:MAG: spore photoproduct lyase [Syntrophomonadaceae bacterium]|nr:spore photoproduct lyase [Syntrophomonadaceae bacterium]
MPFIPNRVIFEEAAMQYPIAKNMWDLFSSRQNITVEILAGRKRISSVSGGTIKEVHQEAKRTLVVGIRKNLKFQSCKPSAHYQLPLVTGCIGHCEYCYLNTQFGKNPYIRVYVNLYEILEQTALYIAQRQPELTFFEGAAVSDPVPVEPYTGSLARTIHFFAEQEYGRFRFVTKFTDIDSLLDIEHKEKTTVRFSINADHIIRTYEHSTPGLNKRIDAANKVAQAGYPLGFIIGPVILFAGWEKQYQQMFAQLANVLKDQQHSTIAFEVISHRFTVRAKSTIAEVFPDSTLPMDENERKFKYGQFGYGKYIYPPEDMKAISDFFGTQIPYIFPGSSINYII